MNKGFLGTQTRQFASHDHLKQGSPYLLCLNDLSSICDDIKQVCYKYNFLSGGVVNEDIPQLCPSTLSRMTY